MARVVGRVVTGRKMKSVHFMLVIAFASFEMSKWKLKVVLYWIKVGILKRVSEIYHICFWDCRCVKSSILCKIKGFLININVYQCHCFLKEGK